MRNSDFFILAITYLKPGAVLLPAHSEKPVHIFSLQKALYQPDFEHDRTAAPSLFSTTPLQAKALAYLAAVLQPALIVLQTDLGDIPWQQYFFSLKRSAGCRRIPVLCFTTSIHNKTYDASPASRDCAQQKGPYHLNSTEQLEMALQFRMEAIIKDTPTAHCDDPLPPDALAGINLIEKGDFYEAHELLEQVWKKEQGTAKTILRVLIQTAAAHHHLSQGNTAGALKLLLSIQHWIAHLPERCHGLNTTWLRAGLQNLRIQILRMEHCGASVPASWPPAPISYSQYTGAKKLLP